MASKQINLRAPSDVSEVAYLLTVACLPGIYSGRFRNVCDEIMVIWMNVSFWLQ